MNFNLCSSYMTDITRSNFRRHIRNGQGLGSFIRKTKQKAKDYLQSFNNGTTRRFDKQVDKIGNESIDEVYIGRMPVQRGVQSALNVLSLGRYGRARKNAGGEIYHNYLIVKTKDGRLWKLEKAQTPELIQAKDSDLKDIHPLNMNGQNLTVRQLIENSSSKDPNLYHYSPDNSNCQDFTQTLLQDSNITSDDASVRDNIIKPQDSKPLIQSLGPLETLPYATTTLAGIADRAQSRFTGRGIKSSNYATEYALPRYGKLNTINSGQIDRYFEGNRMYNGWYLQKNLPIADCKKKGVWVINMDLNPHGHGTHWCGLYANDTYIVWIDPFGLEPPQAVERFMKMSGRKAIYENIQLQDINSDACGWYVMYLLKQITKGRMLTDVIYDDFTQKPAKNEELLRDYFKH
jgi:hypothetical protein